MKAGRYHLTAAQAAQTLGITRATLYAYASRGQLRSEPVPGRPKERRYYREDLERLLERKEVRRDPARAAARGLHWGGPVLESAITLIHEGRFYYRGRDAVALARTASLEETAGVLWDAEEPERQRLFAQPSALSGRRLARLRTCAKDTFTLLQLALPVGAASDLASYDLRPAAVRQTGARIVRLLAAAIAPREGDRPVHRALQTAWAPKRAEVAEVIRTALVLCADHELNVSSFVARCAASAGASPYDVVSAAMATLKGYKHGGASERVLALLAEARTPKSARAAVASRLRAGETLSGFGHPLYAAGDPRASALMRLAEASGNEAEGRAVRHLAKAGSELLQDLPNLDFGLAAVTRTYRLPDYAPALMFALGRSTGWIAHAIEQYESGQLIRPRARYTGRVP
ncbi:MAG: citrate synthase [Acidobacteria bacterium]|nr:MAG: citrate synthase [Acidobacteriota bacterium]